jgi:hypothetical protein
MKTPHEIYLEEYEKLKLQRVDTINVMIIAIRNRMYKELDVITDKQVGYNDGLMMAMDLLNEYKNILTNKDEVSDEGEKK